MNLLHRFSSLRTWSACTALGLALMLGACSSLDRGKPPTLQTQATWTVLPFANHTETPMAGSRAQAIAQSLLVARTGKVLVAPTNTQQEALFDAADEARRQQALEWARGQKVRYALTGTVEEWRYKVGGLPRSREEQAPSIKARPSAVQADQVRREEKRWSRFMVFPVGSEGQKGRR